MCFKIGAKILLQFSGCCKTTCFVKMSVKGSPISSMSNASAITWEFFQKHQGRLNARLRMIGWKTKIEVCIIYLYVYICILYT